jgi:hypothetical protein
MKTYIKIDAQGYFVGFTRIRGNESLDQILKAWNETGGAAADGFEIDTGAVSKIPSDCIDAQPPQIRGGYVPRWTGYDWFYESNIDFPDDPLEGQEFTIGGVAYTWDGDDWNGVVVT